MNDFLKSLRSNSKDKRYDRNDRNERPNRRQYGNGNYGNSAYSGNPQYKNDRNNGNLRKPHRPFEDNRMSLLLEEALPEIKEAVSRLANAGERLVAAEERKANAMERLSNSLQELLLGGSPLAVSRNEPPGIDAASAAAAHDNAQKPTNNVTREAVLDIILTMREEGATYGKIADHLESENIPTFSRKGKWHAQTIHRVCRECA
ncbi:MAG: hypothetical protein RBT16_01205 [Desulfococcus multivorans]|jgi:hypothetical protein|uniref:hypothetical protein n=1 Tax=Desulfococcus sp. TaxID=2025834 RepID=UPI002A43E9CB|nr:hypothetical protein [Desulfococcus multivorans]